MSKSFYCRHKKQGKKRRFVCLASVGFILVLLSIIPIELAIAFKQAPTPQAILTLGGGKEREEFTAQFAQKHPNLEIWVSSGISPDKARQIFQTAGIASKQVHIDCRAVDTVTNFTTLVADFQTRNLQHLYLITANFHMARAKAIATLILGSRGIAFTPVAITNQPINLHHSSESWHRHLRDVLRSIFWIFTGHSGASFNPNPVRVCA